MISDWRMSLLLMLRHIASFYGDAAFDRFRSKAEIQRPALLLLHRGTRRAARRAGAGEILRRDRAPD